jgi:hypothetical protein
MPMARSLGDVDVLRAQGLVVEADAQEVADQREGLGSHQHAPPPEHTGLGEEGEHLDHPGALRRRAPGHQHPAEAGALRGIGSGALPRGPHGVDPGQQRRRLAPEIDLPSVLPRDLLQVPIGPALDGLGHESPGRGGRRRGFGLGMDGELAQLGVQCLGGLGQAFEAHGGVSYTLIPGLSVQRRSASELGRQGASPGALSPRSAVH